MNAPGQIPETKAAPAPAERRRVRRNRGQGRALGSVLLIFFIGLSFYPSASPMLQLRAALFDGYQRLVPRERKSAPAVIVAIDEKSLRELGQWPWPRTTTARLIDAIAGHKPAAIGLDMLLPEPDRMSPGSIARVVENLDPGLAKQLSQLPSNDSILAGALRRNAVSVGLAGIEQQQPGGPAQRGAPFRVKGSDPTPNLRRFPGAVRSLDILDAAAAGHGLLSVDPSGGVVRQAPLLAAVDDVLMPSLSVEVLRIATHTPGFVVVAKPDRVEGIGIGDVFVPTSADGSVWVHFSPHNDDRFISAVDVLRNSVDPEQIRGKIVLIGATGLGLLDFHSTPVGERMPGIEIHAQILENIFDGSLLRRPDYLEKLERLLLLAGGVLLILAVPAVKPRTATWIYAVLMAGILATGIGIYAGKQILFDVAWPAVALTFVFGIMLSGTLHEADRQRRALLRALQTERETAARAAGELEAAQRIQMGMLPPPSADFYEDSRFDLQALIEPAKSVGGDLYDFFKLDSDRLFLMIGDVAGKGLPASIFMAVSKVLYKNAALRMGNHADIGTLMRAANEELARDNPETLFVTVFAGVLDLRTGDLDWCNAGHDSPFCVRAGEDGETPFRLEGASGPPLCVVSGYEYRAEHARLRPGDTLFLFTDGVTEAMNAGGELYGRPRLVSALKSARHATRAIQLVDAIRDDVRKFVQATERSDDLTMLAVHWNGGGA
ncbi:MAG: CHASE2 domain-containing protein [Betaproteobacteria bacterium]